MWIKATDEDSVFQIVNSNEIKSFYVESTLANDEEGETHLYYAVKFDAIVSVPDSKTDEYKEVIGQFEVVWGKEGAFPTTLFETEIEANIFLEELAEKLNAEK